MKIYYRDGYKGQLAKDFVIQVPKSLCPPTDIKTEFIDLDTTGRLTIRSGYAWDFASGPTLDVKWFPGWKKSRMPSLVHDVLCQLHRNGYLEQMDRPRYHADRFFYDLLILKKMWKPRARLWYRGVRIGAKTNVQKPKPILEA